LEPAAATAPPAGGASSPTLTPTIAAGAGDAPSSPAVTKQWVGGTPSSPAIEHHDATPTGSDDEGLSKIEEGDGSEY